MQIMVNIPDDLAACLVPAGRDAARMLLEESAAAAYREHRLSIAQLRRLLDMDSRFEVEVFLATHEIYDYTVDNLDEDLAKLEKLKALTTEPELKTREEIRAWLDDMAKYSAEIPELPDEALTRESMYRDHD